LLTDIQSLRLFLDKSTLNMFIGWLCPPPKAVDRTCHPQAFRVQ